MSQNDLRRIHCWKSFNFNPKTKNPSMSSHNEAREFSLSSMGSTKTLPETKQSSRIQPYMCSNSIPSSPSAIFIDHNKGILSEIFVLAPKIPPLLPILFQARAFEVERWWRAKIWQGWFGLMKLALFFFFFIFLGLWPRRWSLLSFFFPDGFMGNLALFFSIKKFHFFFSFFFFSFLFDEP